MHRRKPAIARDNCAKTQVTHMSPARFALEMSSFRSADYQQRGERLFRQRTAKPEVSLCSKAAVHSRIALRRLQRVAGAACIECSAGCNSEPARFAAGHHPQGQQVLGQALQGDSAAIRRPSAVQLRFLAASPSQEHRIREAAFLLRRRVFCGVLARTSLLLLRRYWTSSVRVSVQRQRLRRRDQPASAAEGLRPSPAPEVQSSVQRR